MEPFSGLQPFLDHFSQGSREYAQARPTYPDELFRRVAECSPSRDAAWDCATGNGQAARGLARHFARVEATDASAQQVEHAEPAPNVAYSVQPAEATNFPPASFDAVCVAQALHWFDVDRFYAEVKRVLKPGGLILVVGYGWSTYTPRFEREFMREVIEPVRPYWPPQNKLLWDGYRDLPFPFEPVAFPKMVIEADWTLAQVMDYVATWTATRRLAEGDPGFLARAQARLALAWGDDERQRVTFPLHIQCGRHVPRRAGE